MHLENHIYELLYKNNCLILPGFGGFVCNRNHVQLMSEYAMLPASKQINFNKNLITNDGLVYNYIAQKFDLTYDKAEEYTKAFIQNIILRIYSGESVFFHQIGKLYLDEEKNIQFFPTFTENFDLKSFGLKKINIHPIKRNHMTEEFNPDLTNEDIKEKIETVQERIQRLERSYRNEEDSTENTTDVVEEIEPNIAYEQIESEIDQEEEELNAQNRKKWRTRIAAILILCLLGGALNMVLNKTGNDANSNQHTSGIWGSIKNIFAAHPSVKDSSTSTEQNNSTADETTASAESSNETPAVTTIENISNGTQPISTNGNVELVFGSFKSNRNAQRLLQELEQKGIHATIQKSSNGFRRVMIKTDAAQVQNIKNQYPSSWIL